eukprot:6171214-Alexandrium_andersonii.AAC.1
MTATTRALLVEQHNALLDINACRAWDDEDQEQWIIAGHEETEEHMKYVWLEWAKYGELKGLG